MFKFYILVEKFSSDHTLGGTIYYWCASGRFSIDNPNVDQDTDGLWRVTFPINALDLVLNFINYA